ncbi:MAG: hypothetical protein JWR47_966 [Phenylobacterium sp.]|jgi:hypothetical protein|uniref:hypothetical protein n=1 Tax=Phenylobacterium sp. TaxID=1871053 RepID=UPI002632FACB|nr:hypothetical protein [Phenylobacterium sp.]MDB5434709.1 hypothetical protein [Phenylobacterium sp.]MDB5463284.1 hypothetical protein [Phenylobacterium sp.]MDB5499578.1 hypothetical protein [Phenylobacterium sp.]
MRLLGGGAVLCALAVGAVAGPSAAENLEASAWAITPEDAACHTDLELVARSGAVAPVALVSDGERVMLRFTREGVPSQAFLPIRIDRKPFANLVQRTGEEGLAVMGLSDETLSALRHGKTLQIAWLSDEAVSASLAGAGQGIADLKTCGAQVAGRRRAREAELEAQRARTQADARAVAVADEQLAAARAQTAAAEAVRQRAAAETEEMAAQAEQDRAMADAARRRALADQERQRAVAAQQYYYYGDRQPAPQPQPAPWNYYRPYDYPR